MGSKRGWNEGEKRRKVVYFFQSTCHVKRQGIEKEPCTREHECPIYL
jgi:hypothetical protein